VPKTRYQRSMPRPTSGDIGFISDASASHAFSRIASELTSKFGDLPQAPKPQQFRNQYAEWLPRFEAARLKHPARAAIATCGAELFVDALSLRGVSVREACAQTGHGVSLDCQHGTGDRDGLLGATVGNALGNAQEMWERGQCSGGVLNAVRWLSDNLPSLDLSDQRFVILGAGAELAPTKLLLEAGAQVLWLDVRTPRLDPNGYAGRLWFPPSGTDLLAEPGRVRAIIEGFARSPVHLGLFAYAPGRLREWGLCATMNALTATLAERLASVTVLLSPASPSLVAPMRTQAPTWTQRLLPKGSGGRIENVSRSVVPAQGVSYQAAQYLGKRLTSEAWAHDPRLTARISCNVAGISRTRSIDHPVFAAAFAGAHHLGVRIFDSDFTARSNGLLMLHDLFGPERGANDLYTQQVHGGTFGLPVPLERAITVAAALGLGRNPHLLGRLLRKP